MNPRLLAALVLLTTSPLLAQEDASSSWPCWRGPNRDGISRETAWSSAGAEEPLWAAEVGPGYSSVSIAGGRLYTLGHDAEQERERVLSLDALTGELLWAHEYPEPTMDLYHGGGANSTPTVAGDTVYVAGRSGRCFAFDAETGAVRWEHDYMSALELPSATYGFAGSPVVVGEDVFLALGATLLCVTAAEGELRWSSKLGEKEGYATPAPFEWLGKPALAAMSGAAFVALDATNGEELARYPWKGPQGAVNATTPIIVGTDVFISSAYDAGAARLSLRADAELELVWYTRKMRNKVSGCTLVDGDLYGFDESMLKCLSFADGSERWRVRGLGMGAVAVAGDRLIILSSKGELVVAERTREEFRELSRRKVLDGGVYWTTPVLLDGLIYARNSLGSLVCLDHRPSAVAAVGDPSRAAPEALALPTPAALFRAYAERSGGAELARHESLRATGHYESTGDGVTRTTMTMEWMTPDRWRIAWDLAEYGWAERVHDGQHAWQADPFYGTFLIEGAARRELAETHRLHGALDWPELAERTETRGLGTFGGRGCWSVAYESRAGARRTLYFERESGLLAGHEAEGEAMVVHADYRDFDGVLLPTRTTWLMPGTGAEETVWIDSVEWDAVEPSAFAAPFAIGLELRTAEEKAADERRLTETYAHLLGDYGAEGEPVHTIELRDAWLSLTVKEDATRLTEADEQGRLFLVGVGEAYCAFTLDEEGRGAVCIIRDLPEDEEDVVLLRLEDGGRE